MKRFTCNNCGAPLSPKAYSKKCQCRHCWHENLISWEEEGAAGKILTAAEAEAERERQKIREFDASISCKDTGRDTRNQRKLIRCWFPVMTHS